ncbi:MAG: RiPP maturation radical SAM C-methyltransferase [Coriobacteriales bacterium]|jgi:magnesium-protoporphyrin IX monomethyl ester (oxidative) cyclase|nr:RiPP maturation radical SAM C-methyltransferase [Coriobacteriales bacterium]
MSLQKDVYLVHAPVAFIHQPSIALGILKASLARRDISCATDYANIRLAQMIGLKDYALLGHSHLISAEVLFSEAAGFGGPASDAAYFDWLRGIFPHKLPEMAELEAAFYRSKQQLDAFLKRTAQTILAHRPKIVAASLSFQQNNASFAILKTIKEIAPQTITVLGGTQCAASAGVALSKYVASVDYVFSGEADDAFAEICQALLAEEGPVDLEQLPYATIRKGDYCGDNLPFTLYANMQDTPIPDYDDYFKTLEASNLGSLVSPTLMIEASRGCWWGEHKPCTFCGEGGFRQKYRTKTSQQVFDTLKTQSERYGIKRFCFTDSIMSREHLQSLTTLLIEADAGYDMFIEVKSNISADDIKQLRDAGFCFLQPGIESLQDDYLRLMNKGNRAIKHVEFLRNCRSYGVTLAWSIILGFPGERAEWMDELCELIPLITHIPPPNGVHHVSFVRYSQYCEYPERYGLKLRPSAYYQFAYPDAEQLVEGIAYLYDPIADGSLPESAQPGYNSAQYLSMVYASRATAGSPHERVLQANRQWQEDFDQGYNRLSLREDGRDIQITDTRRVARVRQQTLTGLKAAIIRRCQSAQKRAALSAELQKAHTEQEIDGALAYLFEHHLLIEIRAELLSLASVETGYSYPLVASPYGMILTNNNPLGHRARRLESLLKKYAELLTPAAQEDVRRISIDALVRLYQAVPNSETPESALAAYPVLPVLIRMQTDNLINYLSELLQHVSRDKDALAGFGATGQLDALKESGGDRHNAGRFVVQLGFANGACLLYKPRAPRLNSAYRDFVAALAQGGIIEAPQLPETLDCDGYFYSRRVEPAAATPGTEQRYYRNAGSLLALSHVLGSTDLHRENIISSGEYPVLVDTETVLSAPARCFARSSNEASKRRDDVLSTQLLSLNRSRKGLALGGIPFAYDGGGQSGDGHGGKTDVRALREGFEQTYRTLMGAKQQVAASLILFKGCSFRVILRKSQVYAQLIAESLAADCLKDITVRNAGIERLAQAFELDTCRAEQIRMTPVLNEERRQIDAGDIPLFYARAEECHLRAADGTILVEDFFEASALDFVASRLESLCEEDLLYQTAIIEKAGHEMREVDQRDSV